MNKIVKLTSSSSSSSASIPKRSPCVQMERENKISNKKNQIKKPEKQKQIN